MKSPQPIRLLTFAGILALGACDAAEPTAPFIDDPASALAAEDQIAVSALAAPATLDAALALADVPLATTPRHGMGASMRADALGNATQARLRFQDATRALADGDPVRAARRAREARSMIARAALAAGGPEAATAMISRVEGLALAVGRFPEDYVDADRLEGDLNMLATRARLRLAQGDTLGAVERAVLAEQRHRQCLRARDGRFGGGEVAVALADVAVALGGHLVDQAGAADEQLRILSVAAKYTGLAHDALSAGDVPRATHLAGLAEWTALRAVVWPDGVNADEARELLELAEAKYAQAAASPTLSELQTTVLQRARDLINAGTAALAEGAPRGTGAIWRALVACTWITS